MGTSEVAGQTGAATLVGTLVEKGFRVSAFREPDLRGSLTAIAVEPAAWKHLSGLRLVK